MKGQWFIISAVVASSAFLGLSLLMKDYFVVDSSKTARLNNDFYFNSIESQLDKIVSSVVVDGDDCVNLTTTLDELKSLSERELAAKGIFFGMNYTLRDCPQKIVDFNIIVASGGQTLYNFSTVRDPGEFIK